MIGLRLRFLWDSLVAKTVKKLPAVPETSVQSLGWEDPLEKEMATPSSILGMATHSSILAWRISWMEGPGGLQSMGLQRVGHACATSTHTHTHTHTHTLTSRLGFMPVSPLHPSL